jgi:hypothetical protein
MKYHINQEIVIKKTTEVKMIVDKEIIHNTPIYYMSDLTSYSESELSDDMSLVVIKLINNNSKIFELLFDFDNINRKLREAS